MEKEVLMLLIGCVTLVIVVLIVGIGMLIFEYWNSKKINVSRDELRRLQDQSNQMYALYKELKTEIEKRG